MSLTGLSLDGIKTYGKEQIMLHVKWAVGAVGAVGAISGRGFTGQGPNEGSVARDSEGNYTVVCPGRGSFHDLSVIGALISVNGNDLECVVRSCVAATRTVTLECVDLTDGATADDPADGDSIHLTVLVKNTDVR